MPAPLPRSPELMNADDTALLLVDVQERLAAAVRESENVVWNCGRLLRGAAALGVACAASEQYPEKLGPTLPRLAEHFAPDAGRPTAKRMFSCRGCEEMVPTWLTAGRFRVLLAGVETHVCIQQTALDLQSAGLRVYVAVDAVGSRSERDHQTALRRLESSGVTLTTTEAALFEWCVGADNPAFKTISALAKETSPG